MNKLLRIINLKDTFILFVIVVSVMVFKKVFIPSLFEENYLMGIHNILYVNTDSLLISVFWLIPILSSSYFISQLIYYKLINFDVRYINRKNYAKYNMINLFLIVMIFNVLVGIIQLLVFSFNYGYSFQMLPIILQYGLGNTILCFIIVYLSLIIRNFIFSYITIITLLMILQKIIPIFIRNMFVGQFSFINLIIIVLIILIYKLYLKYDIGGES